MPLTLVQLLAARGLAQVDLQAAEARRVKLGGGLETSLLELGVLGETAVGELWSEASRLPRPASEQLAEVTSAMAPLFPQQLAERYGMVPLGLVRRQLSLLARHPVDLSTVDEISFLLSRPLKLFVGTELEIAELLGVVYGVPVPQRLKDLRAKLRPSPGGAAPIPVAPAQVEGTPAPASASPAAVEAAAAQSGAAPATEPEPDKAVRPEEVQAAPSDAPLASSEAATAPSDPAPVQAEPTAPAEPAQSAPPVEVREPLPPPSPPATFLPPPRRSVSPGEPWSINLPLVEPPSASSRTRAAVERPARTEIRSELPAQAGHRPDLISQLQYPPEPEIQAAPQPEARAEIRAEAPPAVVSPQFSLEELATAVPPEPERLPEAPAVPSAPSAALPSPQPSLTGPAEESPLPPAPLGERQPPSAEASPFEATPMSSGYGGRSGPDHRMTAGESLAAMKVEQTRDGVIGVVVDFLRGAFDFVAVFVRHEETFEVFEATGVDYGGGADLTQTIVDLDRSRVLRTVVEGKAPYVGPIPAGDPLEGALGALGRGRLRAVFMYPVVIRDRTIAVVHGDRGGEALAPRQLSDVALVLSQLGAQLERVIRQRRKVQRGSPPLQRPPALSAVPVAPIEPARAATEQPSAGVPTEEISPPSATQPSPSEPKWGALLAAGASPETRPAVEGSQGAAPQITPPPSPPGAFAMAPPAPGEDFEALATAEYETFEQQLGSPDEVDEEPFEIPVEWVDPTQGGAMADHVRAFLSGDPPARALAAQALREGGEDAAWALSERFPGPLFVFRMTIDELPGPEAMGPVIGMLASLGGAALPALSNLSESPNEERRFWATMLIAKSGNQAAVPVLARRLLDQSPDVALAARRGLWRLRGAPEFAEVLQHATSELSSGDPEKSIPIVRALGQFHHVPAIPLLIGMLGSRDSQLSQAANEALREIARQDFGTSERRWNAWWEQAQSMPRIHWVIDALEDRDRDLRLAAISELTELTGFDFGYRSDLDPGRQASALQRWREWLERDGRSRATPAPFPAGGG